MAELTRLTPFVFEYLSFVPKNKITTYKKVAEVFGIGNPRLVGKILHKNTYPREYKCYKVVRSDGSIASGYRYGGREKQIRLLRKEGIAINKNRVDIEKHLWNIDLVFELYFKLLSKYGFPGKWPWFEKSNNPSTADEIVIGALLTQNVSWENVEYAITNLKRAAIHTLNDVYNKGKGNLDTLKKLIKPVGFYNQKSEYLFNLSEGIVKNFKHINNLKTLPLHEIRNFLLSQKGVGKETADTIILYALEKPIFVIDNYTKRFVERFKLTGEGRYDKLQQFFEKRLPCNVGLYQNYHALIVRWGKDRRG